MVLLNISKEYGKRLIESEHSLVASLPGAPERGAGMAEEDIEGSQELVYGSFRYQVLNTEASIQVTSGTEGRNRKMRTQYQSMPVVLNELKSS